MIQRNAKWYRFYYLFQELLSKDTNYMETVLNEREGVGNGVRKESSLPFALNTLASELTDIELTNEEDNIPLNFALHYWKTVEKNPKIVEQRLSDSEPIKVQDPLEYNRKVAEGLSNQKLPKQVHNHCHCPEPIFKKGDEIYVMGSRLKIVKVTRNGYWTKYGKFIPVNVQNHATLINR